jgi:hypothetical protein
MSDENAPGDDPNLRPLGESLAAAAKKSGFGAVEPGQAPTSGALLKAMGGVRGLVESILPGLAFVVIYTITSNVPLSVLIPVGLAVVLVIVRAITRTPWTSALAGVLGVGLSAGLALITGNAKDNFVLGFFINGAFLVALIVSIAVRWPLIGVIVSLIRSEGSAWRKDAARFRVALIASLLWVGLFAVRLAVELPLYFAEGENGSVLGATKLILGVPLYAAMLWVTWLLVRTVYARPERD